MKAKIFYLTMALVLALAAGTWLGGDHTLAQTWETVSSPNTPVPIPDGFPPGVTDTIDFPDLGIAQDVIVSIDISNSDIAFIEVTLYDPNGISYTLYDGSWDGTWLLTSYPDPTPTVTGDLDTWIGQNPQGTWALNVTDYQFDGYGFDGQINSWSISIILGIGTDPVICRSPSSFSFTAVEGGANPPGQTLSIWNSGGGTLSWSVSDDAPWLALSPVSGSSTGETDNVTVSANISGMSAGTYNATITISAPGATNTPQTVPVSLSIALFWETVSSPNTPVPIPDAFVGGVTDTIDFPDLGIAEDIRVSIDITNSDLNSVRVTLSDPNANEYILWCGQDVLGFPGCTGDTASTELITSYPDPTPTVTGDLTTWIGQNPQGTWALTVIDTGAFGGGNDGYINSWSISIGSTPSDGAGGGCFIATAAYGSYLDGHVQTLRTFRDSYLVTNPVGEALVSAYYKLSPPIARFIDEHPALEPIVRVGLLPAVAMSTVAVSTTSAEKLAIVSSIFLVSALVVVWLRRKGHGVRRY